MSDLVPTGQIERIVGARRRSLDHLAHADSSGQRVYLMHSHLCVMTARDLRDCFYSLALRRGIDEVAWAAHQDRPVVVDVAAGRLIPMETR